VCQAQVAYGKRHSPRQLGSLPKKFAVGQLHTANGLFAACPLPCAAHGKPFAVGFWGFVVCPWHTAKGLSSVVVTLLLAKQTSLNYIPVDTYFKGAVKRAAHPSTNP